MNSLVILPVVSQSLRMYILGEEAMVANPQGTVAGGHVARSTGGHLPYCGHRHPCHHCGHTDLHGPKGRKTLSQHPLTVTVKDSNLNPVNLLVINRYEITFETSRHHADQVD